MKISEQFVVREIAGDYVVVPTGDTALRLNVLLTLNDSGLFLWRLLAEERTMDQLTDALCTEYDVDRATAAADAEAFVAVLLARGILTDSPTP